MMTAGIALGATGTVSAHTPQTAPAQTAASPVQRATVVGSDVDDGDRFGWSIATDGDTALIGAVTDDDPNGEDAGSVYVFEGAGEDWTQTAKLAPDDGDDGDLFGSAVALDGDTALIGARQDEDPASAGSAYVFERTDGGWEQAAKLVPDTISARALLGWSVTVAGETALVGAPRNSTGGGDDVGSVFVFEPGQAGWEQQATLSPGDVSGGALFGTAVAAAGDIAVVGAAGTQEPNGDQAGTAYIFERTDDGSWTRTDRLVPDDGDDGDLFGSSVAIGGETAVISAVGDEDPNGADAGSTYVFEGSGEGWTQTAKLAPDDGTEGEEFGWAVAIENETALIGARRTDQPSREEAGAAYIFEDVGDEWTLRAKMAPDTAGGARAGSAVGFAGETAFLGAPNDTPGGESADVQTGSVSVFDLTGESTPTATATPTPTPRDVPTSTPTPTPGEEGPGFGIVATLTGLAGWLWWRRSH